MKFDASVPGPIPVLTEQFAHEVEKRCRDYDGILGVDTEGTGLDPHTDEALWMGICPNETDRYFVPRRLFWVFKDLLEDPAVEKALHNGNFDRHMFENAGIKLDPGFFDTMYGDWLEDEDTREGRHSLDAMSWDYLGVKMGKWSDLFGHVSIHDLTPEHVLWGKFLDYGTLDAWATRKLALRAIKILAEDKLMPDHPDPKKAQRSELSHYWEYINPEISDIWWMERRGIRLDRDYLMKLSDEFAAQIAVEERALNRLAGRMVNVNSGPQVSKLLFDDLGLRVRSYSKQTKNRSADAKTLEYYSDIGIKEAQHILKARQLRKLISTYLEPLLLQSVRDGKVYTSFRGTLTTQRLGSSDPNLQNIPVRTAEGALIRKAFIPDNPDDEVMIVLDYSQLEFRILCFLANEQEMMRRINAGKLDIHSYTAAMIFGFDYDEFVLRYKQGDIDIINMRRACKAINFGIAYGQTGFGLARKMTEELKRPVSRQEADREIRKYFKTFPGIEDYIYSTIRRARKLGFVQDIAGRKRRLSKINHDNPGVRNHAENQAINTPIQGTAALTVMRAMRLVNNDPVLRELGYKLLLQVHDELVGSGPKKNQDAIMARKKYLMENVYAENPLPVMLEVDGSIASSWGEAK